MTHLPFIAASYALGTLIPLGFTWGAWRRSRAVQQRLAAVESRRS